MMAQVEHIEPVNIENPDELTVQLFFRDPL